MLWLQLFNGVIVSSPQVEQLVERLKILISEITLAIYTNVSRGLFERHKLVFSFMLCTSILRNAGNISDAEWTFLLRGGVAGSVAVSTQLNSTLLILMMVTNVLNYYSIYF